MDVSVITQLVGSLGFPIVACCALFWKMNKDSELHQEETNKLTEALNNNTLVLSKLCEKLDGGDIIGTENKDTVA